MKRTGRRTSIQNEFISIPEQPRACPCCRCGGRCWQFSRIANVEICSSVVAAAVLLLAEPSRVGGPGNPLCWLLNGLGGPSQVQATLARGRHSQYLGQLPPPVTPQLNRKSALNGREKLWLTIERTELRGFQKIRKVFTLWWELIESGLSQMAEHNNCTIFTFWFLLLQCKFFLSCLSLTVTSVPA